MIRAYLKPMANPAYGGMMHGRWAHWVSIRQDGCCVELPSVVRSVLGPKHKGFY